MQRFFDRVAAKRDISTAALVRLLMLLEARRLGVEYKIIYILAGMKLTTEYTIYFLGDSSASFTQGQRVLMRNQNPELHMPAYFDSEGEALAWVERNGPDMARAGEFVILPVHRMGY